MNIGYLVGEMIYPLDKMSITDHLAKGAAIAGDIAVWAALDLDGAGRLLRAGTLSDSVPCADGKFAVMAICGDFLTEVPEADLYLLRFFLHDWDNASCDKTRSNCGAVHAGGRMLVIKKLIGSPGAPDEATIMDLNMMVVLGGRERREEEFRALFAQAGLLLTRPQLTDAPMLAVLGATAVESVQ